MNYINELKEVVALTKIVYSNNFTKESNYIHFIDNTCYTSNTSNGVGDDEMIIFHEFKSPLPFQDIAIPSKELHGVLDSISDTAVFTQKEDCIVITDNNRTITLPIEKYVEPPNIDLGGLNYLPIPSLDLERIEKRLLQFVYKTDEDGSKIHFVEDVFSTDINSIQREVINAELPTFAIPLQIYSVMKNFAHLALDDYLYLRAYIGTVLVTKHYPVMDIDFITQLHRGIKDKTTEISLITIPQFDAGDLFKVFGLNTKKPDREVTVSVNEHRIEISTGDDLTGFVSVDLESCKSNPVVKFKIGTEKLFELMNNYEEIFLLEIAGEKALWGSTALGSNKYVVIEEVV